jgi:hypothetical protein
VIESGAGVEQTVSNDNTQLFGRFGTQPNSQDSDVRILLSLRDKLALAVFESFEHFDYVLKVLVCPGQFQSAAR